MSLPGYVAPLGAVATVLISIIAVRLLSYWSSLLISWRRYRTRTEVSTADLVETSLPHLKVQITTRGSQGSTEVILRGIGAVLDLAREAPELYRRHLSVEVVTEDAVQARALALRYADAPVDVTTLHVPEDYATPNGALLKARGLHHAVERRRQGWNAKPGRTFVVHYDEESVMLPAELRKLFMVTARTARSVLEGPLYYPLEYTRASVLAQSMEANRPAGCLECRRVMEEGVPLHLHGSNLVVEEEFENRIGWDIGRLDGEAFIAEDFVFGMNAFLEGGPEAFGWHGCVMLEQPPFSVRSAFRQRHRWIFGVLQGVTIARRSPRFAVLPWSVRTRLVAGTWFRIATFAGGAPVAALALSVLPFTIAVMVVALVRGEQPPVDPWLAAWMAVVGVLWLGSVALGAVLNVRYAPMSTARREVEVLRAVAVAPLAGGLESAAGLWAVLQWWSGKRGVVWVPTPKTAAAEAAVTAGQR